VSEPSEVEVLARRLAGFDLPGSDQRGVEVAPRLWVPFLATLREQRLSGLALAAADRGTLQLVDQQAEELRTLHREAMTWSLLVERKLVELTDAFQAARIDAVVLKGPAIAHRAYPDPSWRPFGDLDLLVRTSDWHLAGEVLSRLGHLRQLPEPRPGFDERFGKAAVWTKGDRIEVDLHRTLVVGPFGLWIEPEDLVQRTETFALGGRSLLRLDATAMFLHACMHAVLGWTPPLLWTLRDVAQMAWSTGVDWATAAELARRWRLGSVVAHALRWTSDKLEVSLPQEASDVLTIIPSSGEQKALDAYITGKRERSGPAVSTIVAIRGVRRKAAYVRALLFPTRSFLAARSGSGRGSYVRRLMVPLRWLTTRRG
jgi:hypothetical protein